MKKMKRSEIRNLLDQDWEARRLAALEKRKKDNENTKEWKRKRSNPDYKLQRQMYPSKPLPEEPL